MLSFDSFDNSKLINACVPEWSKGLVSKTSSIHPGFESQAQVPKGHPMRHLGDIGIVWVYIKTQLDGAVA